jgi:hypothetical protein
MLYHNIYCTTQHYTLYTRHYTTLHDTTLSTTYYTTLHYTAHFTTLHCTLYDTTQQGLGVLSGPGCLNCRRYATLYYTMLCCSVPINTANNMDIRYAYSMQLHGVSSHSVRLRDTTIVLHHAVKYTIHVVTA